MPMIRILLHTPSSCSSVSAAQLVHAQSPFVLFSSSIAPVLLVLSVSAVANSNSGQLLVQALPEFEKVVVRGKSTGACQDALSRNYDYIEFEGGKKGSEVSSTDDCERLCVACACEVSVSNTNRVFRGFTYQPTDLCFCYFDADQSAPFAKNECQNMNAGKNSLESPDRYKSGRDGSGPIEERVGTGGECWKTKEVFSTSQCPSDAPSESPSVSKAPSLSGSPSISPSESARPSTSASPSSSSSPTTAKSGKTPKRSKSSKTSKASTLQIQEMKSGGSPSLSSLAAAGVCGTFAVIAFMLVDLI